MTLNWLDTLIVAALPTNDVKLSNAAGTAPECV